MNLNEKVSILEAVLFACGEAVSISKIAEICDMNEADVYDAIDMLNERYDNTKSALKVVKLGESCQLATRIEYASYIKDALGKKHSAPLSLAAMESLTVIAYNQPVTKAFVEKVRGVDSSSIINSLAEKGLIEEAGRLDIPGRPITFKTTDNFLRCFGISSLGELPSLPESVVKVQD